MVEKASNPTENLHNLANLVLQEYGIRPRSIIIIQSGTVKTVWKVKTENETLCLKRLKQSYDKALFSTFAQVYIKNAGGNVPAIIPDQSNRYIVAYENELFVLYEWLQGRDLDFGNSSDLDSALQGLARFHLTSKGYLPDPEARVSSKLNKWLDQYDSMKRKLTAWKEIAENNAASPSHAAYLECTDAMIELANRAMDLLSKSKYEELTSPESSSIVLCHQDFGKGNALLTDDGVYVIDLDGVTFDLPARDLRKIIGKHCENKNLWYEMIIRNVLQWYEAVSPLKKAEKEILYIDLLYPHWYYGLVKNLYKNNKALKPSEIKKIAKLEMSKVPILNSLLGREGK